MELKYKKLQEFLQIRNLEMAKLADKIEEDSASCKQLYSESEIKACYDRIQKDQSNDLKRTFYDFSNKFKY